MVSCQGCALELATKVPEDFTITKTAGPSEGFLLLALCVLILCLLTVLSNWLASSLATSPLTACCTFYFRYIVFHVSTQPPLVQIWPPTSIVCHTFCNSFATPLTTSKWIFCIQFILFSALSTCLVLSASSKDVNIEELYLLHTLPYAVVVSMAKAHGLILQLYCRNT